MRFKTTENIFKNFGEVFDESWMNSNKIITPPKKDWDYLRKLQIEDVDVWEVIYEQGGAVGIYAAWSPYAEFYMIRVGWLLESKGYGVETYYGPGSMNRVIKRAEELEIPISKNKIMVDSDQMWLYQEAK